MYFNAVEVELNKNKPTCFVVSSNSCTFACKTNNMAKHNDTGKWGEEMAADYLRNSGYEIIERDWRDGHRDIATSISSRGRPTCAPSCSWR